VSLDGGWPWETVRIEREFTGNPTGTCSGIGLSVLRIAPQMSGSMVSARDGMRQLVDRLPPLRVYDAS